MFILIFVFVLVGCGRGKAESKTDTKSNMLDTVLLSEIVDDDPFSELVAQYSLSEMEKIIKKTEPLDVTDLFLLLPETDFLFYFNFSIEQRKKMLKKEMVSNVELNEIDVANGYMQSGYEGIWEMFAKKIDGVWWIAVYENNCGEYCNTVQAKTYTFDKGKLIKRSYANLAGYQDVWVELFIDFNQLTVEQQKVAYRIWEENGLDALLFRLPRDGKTITMYIEAFPYLEAGIPEVAIKEVKTELWK